ncbi:ATP-binding protein [Oceanobacillus damuensis]|uniref:ATP-binding protein n=1 Tax=Oceanobacillus damuensis TaxID=937928 RepID=UPI000830BCB6|nr:AAA family ATPase [Oceanobacillus damuensis]
MKIVSATIYGFGKWVDYKLDFSQDSATCLYGENESGKSTIQKFILFMLFGLTPKQREFYRPKTSGKMGGRMIIHHPETGEFVIERFDEVKNGAAVCVTPDGTEHDEVWLQKTLNGMTARTYQSIFSFSAMDLYQIRNMKDEELGEVLLGIGLTGSNNIYTVERRLEAKIGELFKPTGKKPIINQQLESLNSISNSMQRFKETEQSYRDKKEAIEHSDRALTNLQQSLKEKKALAFSIEKHLHAFPLIQEYLQLKNRMTDYPKSISFPENGVERLEKWKESLLPLQSEWNVLEENERAYIEKIKSLEHNLHSDSIQKEAETLLDEQKTVNTQIQELKKIKNDLYDAEQRMNEEIDRLNIGIRKEELESLELPFYLEKTWNQIRSENEQLKLERDQLTGEQNQLKQERDYLLDQMKQLENRLLPDNQVDELKERIHAFNQYHLMEKIKQQSEKEKEAWNKNKAGRKKKTSSILTGSILAAILSGLAGTVAEIPWLYTVMIALIAIGTVQWFMTNRSISNMDKMFQTETKQTSEKVTDEEKMEAEHLLEIHNENKNELNAFKQQEKLGETQFVKWNEKKKQLDERENRLHEQINQQYKTHLYLMKVEIAFWPEFFHSLNQLFQMNRKIKNGAGQIAELEKKISAFHENLDRFLTNYSVEHADRNYEDKLEAVKEVVKSQEEKLQEREHFVTLLGEIKEKQQDLKQKMQTYEIEIDHLLEIAEVETEESFYYQARQFKEKSGLKQELRKTVTQLSKILPQETIQEYTEQTATEEELEAKMQEISTSIGLLEEQLESEREKQAALKAELAAMETSESYSNSMHQYEMQSEELRKLAREWSVLKTAREMLTETKSDYRNKYLTKVIEVTTKYFKEITGNMYNNVYAPTGNTPFQVESPEKIRYTIDELSQGTIDQLYVSLRLAISEIMSEDNGLPFIIDDAFVHFDSLRTNRMIKILEQAAEKQQVILLTCKEEVAKAGSGMKRIDLTGRLYV